MFDGSYRRKRGCYFYSYENSLTEYHKKRLSIFGEVPINLIKEENQLYFSYTIGYIASVVLEMKEFRSTKCFLSDKLKDLCKDYKLICDEIIKAMIVDEGSIEGKITSRTRIINFKNNPKWTYTNTIWKISFSASSFQELYNSLSPLPIIYKQANLKFLSDIQNRPLNQRKKGETKMLIVKSLLESPKSIDELAKELLVKQTTIRAHLKGHPTYDSDLINMGLVHKVNEIILRRGGFAKVCIYGAKDIDKAHKFLRKEGA